MHYLVIALCQIVHHSETSLAACMLVLSQHKQPYLNPFQQQQPGWQWQHQQKGQHDQQQQKVQRIPNVTHCECQGHQQTLFGYDHMYAREATSMSQLKRSNAVILIAMASCKGTLSCPHKCHHL